MAEIVLNEHMLEEITLRVGRIEKCDKGKWPGMLRLASGEMHHLQDSQPDLIDVVMQELVERLGVINLPEILEVGLGQDEVGVVMEKRSVFAKFF